MTLAWLILIPLAAGILAPAVARLGPRAPRVLALAALAVDLALACTLPAGSAGRWWMELRAEWIPRFGIGIHLGVDGLSFVLILLTLVLGILSVLASWTEIQERVGFFHSNILWVLAGVLGVFLSLDLFLFYLFWELMLIPMFLLILVWGHERRRAASLKFFLFTQSGGLLMLVSIVALAFAHYQATGDVTFDSAALLGTPLRTAAGRWIFLGFVAAFAVKLPAVPLHTWLPDAHTQAPTAGSVILAGLLLKTGAYGLIRFAIPLFPEAAAAMAPVFRAVGAVGILYGAALAFAQTDLKRLVAYTSVSHLGFVLLGIFSWNRLALQGAVAQMVCHGLSTGGLFVLVGFLQERIHTRDSREMGGLWPVVPRMGAAGMVLAMASLGLPGLGNFVAEFLTLLGSYRADPAVTWVATIGLVFATVYALAVVQRAFLGPRREGPPVRDLGGREVFVIAVLVAGLLVIGLYPQPLLDVANPALAAVERLATFPVR